MADRSRICIVAALACCASGSAHAKASGRARDKVDTLVIHAIGGPRCSDDGKSVVFRPVVGDARAWKQFFEAHEELGIHWIVDRAGAVVSSIPEGQVANHAKGNNDASIGVELVNRGDGLEPYPEAQIEAALKLAREIVARWHIPLERVLRHSDVDRAPALPCGSPRKVDPGPQFSWARFKERLAR
jgi:N-acetylmuramoyl-L-alanine amidase